MEITYIFVLMLGIIIGQAISKYLINNNLIILKNN
jgi:hypothetical protein